MWNSSQSDKERERDRETRRERRGKISGDDGKTKTVLSWSEAKLQYISMHTLDTMQGSTRKLLWASVSKNQ